MKSAVVYQERTGWMLLYVIRTSVAGVFGDDDDNDAGEAAFGCNSAEACVLLLVVVGALACEVTETGGTGFVGRPVLQRLA